MSPLSTRPRSRSVSGSPPTTRACSCPSWSRAAPPPWPASGSGTRSSPSAGESGSSAQPYNHWCDSGKSWRDTARTGFTACWGELIYPLLTTFFSLSYWSQMLSSQQHRDGGAGQTSLPERCSPQGKKLEIYFLSASVFLYLNGFNPRNIIWLQSSLINPHTLHKISGIWKLYPI